MIGVARSAFRRPSQIEVPFRNWTSSPGNWSAGKGASFHEKEQRRMREHWTEMPRKLKVFKTSQGFFDLAIAATSMKAALAAWGASSNLFHQWDARNPKTKR
jgi:hypothetical protein